jgi:hypothetical protein
VGGAAGSETGSASQDFDVEVRQLGPLREPPSTVPADGGFWGIDTGLCELYIVQASVTSMN